MAAYSLLSKIMGRLTFSGIKVDFGGTGTSASPAFIKLRGTDGTDRYAFINTSGSWSISPTLPTSNTVGGDDTVYTATGTITSAQLLSSFTTAVTLIAAPGAGKHLVYDRGYFWHAAGTAYTSNDHTVRYTNISGTAISATLTASGFTTSATAQQRILRNVTTAISPVSNAAIVLTTATADPTTGTFDVLYEIKYRVVTDKI